MKTVVALALAALMASAVTANAFAGEKRKIRPHLTQQVLSATYKTSLNIALLKASHQVRIQPRTSGKF